MNISNLYQTKSLLIGQVGCMEPDSEAKSNILQTQLIAIQEIIMISSLQ